MQSEGEGADKLFMRLKDWGKFWGSSVSCQIDSKMKRWWTLLAGSEYPTDLDT